MSKTLPLLLAGLLASATASAADSAPAATMTATTNEDVEAQLAAARQKLEAAARDVARLSSQLGQSAMARIKSLPTRAVLGLQLETQPSTKDRGAVVTGVSPGGPAAEAGVVTGDVIVGIDGQATTGPGAAREVVERMASVKPDARVTVKVLRDGKPKEFQVTARAGMTEFFPGMRGPGSEWRPGIPGPGWEQGPMHPIGGGMGAIFEGMELADLSPALGEYFGTTQGVLVIRVPHDGEFLKLQDGDVILSIDGRIPENGSHATRILRSYQPGEKIGLKVIRQKKTLQLEGTLPQRRYFGPGSRPGGPPDRGPGPQDRPPPG